MIEGLFHKVLNRLNENDQLFEFYRLIETACKPVFELLDENPAQIRARAEAWLEAAADGGSAAAKLISSDKYPGALPDEEFQSILYPAISEAQADASLKDSVYFTILSYIDESELELIESFGYSSALDYAFTTDRDAWSYLWCINTHECRVEQEFSDTIQLPHVLETIEGRVAELQKSIENEDWEKLRLIPEKG